jgi:hypothetical protein
MLGMLGVILEPHLIVKNYGYDLEFRMLDDQRRSSSTLQKLLILYDNRITQKTINDTV